MKSIAVMMNDETVVAVEKREFHEFNAQDLYAIKRKHGIKRVFMRQKHGEVNHWYVARFIHTANNGKAVKYKLFPLNAEASLPRIIKMMEMTGAL